MAGSPTGLLSNAAHGILEQSTVACCDIGHTATTCLEAVPSEHVDKREVQQGFGNSQAVRTTLNPHTTVTCPRRRAQEIIATLIFGGRCKRGGFAGPDVR